jgi:hypothetical protein
LSLTIRRKLEVKLKPFMLGFCLSALAIPQLNQAEELPLLGKAAPLIEPQSLSMIPDAIQFHGGAALDTIPAVTEANIKTTDVVDIQGSIELRDSNLAVSE